MVTLPGVREPTVGSNVGGLIEMLIFDRSYRDNIYEKPA